MKRLFGFLFLTFFVFFIFISCNDEQAPTAVNEDGTQVFLKPNNGTEIFRYSDESWFGFIDWDTGLRLRVGINSDDWCADGYPTGQIFDFKDMILPNNDPENWDRLMTMIRGSDIYAEVRAWPPDYNVYPDNCAYYAAVPPIATGYIKVMYKDNDVDAWARDANANVYSLKAHGKLQGPDGESYNLNAYYKAWFKGYFEPPDYLIYHEQFFRESAEIKLR